MQATRSQLNTVWVAVVLLVGLVGMSSPALAAGGAAGVMQHANNELENTGSLQRGARNFMNYCVGCHSMQYVRYNRIAQDLGLDEDQVRENLIFGVDKINSTVTTAMTKEQSKAWFNAAPPDLSLTARSRGSDWIYTYLKSFYLDDSRTFGVNNKLLEGSSMPHVLWELQGFQKAVYRDEAFVDEEGQEQTRQVFDHFEMVEEGSLSPDEFSGFARDITNFMEYAAEPIKLKRQRLGMMVLAFLLVLAVLSYALKVEYWKDIH
ncbi:MAG: cytochrome c1 [Gammaproteobacteria bacterium]